MRARVANWLTRTASGTSPTLATSGPSATRPVDAATAPSSGKAEIAGRAGWPIGKRWSYTKTPSRPAASAATAAAKPVSASGRKLGMTRPTRIMGQSAELPGAGEPGSPAF